MWLLSNLCGRFQAKFGNLLVSLERGFLDESSKSLFVLHLVKFSSIKLLVKLLEGHFTWNLMPTQRHIVAMPSFIINKQAVSLAELRELLLGILISNTVVRM
jgi:hypothetical protein